MSAYSGNTTSCNQIQSNDLILHVKQIMHTDYNQIINLKEFIMLRRKKIIDDFLVILELLQFVGFEPHELIMSSKIRLHLSWIQDYERSAIP
jgi:hypothetical protein